MDGAGFAFWPRFDGWKPASASNQFVEHHWFIID
jgi:hypothetical protein